MLGFPLAGRRHWRRYREIAQILFRHGFDQVIDLLELAPFLSLPARWLRQHRTAEDWTAPERMRVALEELGPTFIKLGQILSTRPDLLPPDFVYELAKLQDSAPPFPSSAARQLIETELAKPMEQLFASFDDTPVAAASLGQVHRAVLPDGQRIVVKIQRPDIQRAVETDLEILSELAKLAQSRTPLGDIYDLSEIADEFASTLREELDYQREGRNAERFARNFSSDDAVHIPKVFWEYTTSRILVLEEIQGIKINNLPALDAAGIDRHCLALESARVIVKQVFQDSFFHGDPHPGNFFVMPSPNGSGAIPRIGAMDFGMVGWIDPKTRQNLLRLMVGIVRRDVEGIVDEFLRMDVVEWGKFDRKRLERDLQHFLNRYWGRPLKEWRAHEILEDLLPLAFRHHLRFPSDLWMLAKVLSMSEGLARQLDPDFDFFAVAEPYARQLYLQMVSPPEISRRTFESLSDWSEELLLLPQQLRHVVERFERGAIQVVVREESHKASFDRWDRMVSRLAASILIAALIIAVGALTPLLTSETWRFVAIILIILAFINATVLAFWLLLSTIPWRAR